MESLGVLKFSGTFFHVHRGRYKSIQNHHYLRLVEVLFLAPFDSFDQHFLSFNQ